MLFKSLPIILESLVDYNLSQMAEVFKSHILRDSDRAVASTPFLSDRYSRTIIHQVDDFDVVLIGWAPGQCSPIHNHPSNGCLVYPIKGELLEQRYCDELKPISQSTVGVGGHSYIDDGICIHRLGNASSIESAISVHIYSPSNFVPTLFESSEEEGVLLGLI